MRALAHARVAAALIGITAGSGLLAQEISRPPVLIDVAVEDAAGALVTDLAAADFEIVTGGRVASIASFAINRQPLNLVLLLDVSASVLRRVDKDVIEDDADAFFVRRLQAGERARIGGFAASLVLSKAFTSDQRLLKRALDAAVTHRRETTLGPSPIWDHTYEAIESLSTVPGRRAVALFTDGRATGNHRSIVEAAEHAARLGVTINVIGEDRQTYIQQDSTRAVVVRPRNHLLWIADVSGGRYLPAAETDRRPGLVLQQLLAELRQVYTVGFQAPVPDGKLHALEVRIKRPNLKIRAPRVFAAPN